MKRVEPKTVFWAYVFTVFNLVFHVVKLILWEMVFYEVYTPHSWYDKLEYWNALFVLTLSFLILFTGVRILNVANSFSHTAY